MTFPTSSNTYLWMTAIMSLTLRITLIAIILLIALGLGLLLRRLLIQRLKQTVLDAWIVQTLGVAGFFSSPISSGVACFFFLGFYLFFFFFYLFVLDSLTAGLSSY